MGMILVPEFHAIVLVGNDLNPRPHRNPGNSGDIVQRSISQILSQLQNGIHHPPLGEHHAQGLHGIGDPAPLFNRALFFPLLEYPVPDQSPQNSKTEGAFLA